MTASDIRALLDCRHSKDIVCHEAPCGSGYASGYGQIDTWVLRPSWTRPAVIGYEIKVSRRDFLADQKWMGYLPYCNELYFAVAPGVCTVEEMPEGVGLLEATKNGGRILTRRKAAHRLDGLDLETVFRSILMNRAVIKTGGRFSSEPETREVRMERWRRAAEDRRKLGIEVSQAIHKEWKRLEDEAGEANRRADGAEAFRKVMRKHGFDPDRDPWYFERDLQMAVGDGLRREIDSTIRTLESLRDRLPKRPAAAPGEE